MPLNDRCRRLRHALLRVAEGEAGPEETLRVARHLPACTACRIVLAKERRLHALLDALDDPHPAPEGLAEQVMAALPPGPPPTSPRRRLRRKLRLLGSAMLAAASAAAAGHLAGGAVRAGAWAWPRLADGGLEEIGNGAATVLGWVAATVVRAISGSDVTSLTWAPSSLHLHPVPLGGPWILAALAAALTLAAAARLRRREGPGP